ncbi:MAG: trimethylamine methyltransferase family protein [Candidatus Latescibacterota bacterium]
MFRKEGLHFNYSLPHGARKERTMLLLDHAAKQRIHEGSLSILSELGVRVEHAETLSRLESRGAKIDRTARIAHLPETLVEWALERAPSAITLSDRRGRRFDLHPRGDSMYWTGNALYMIEGDRRVDIDSDRFIQMARLVDALDQPDAMVGTSLCDVPPVCRDFVGFRLIAEHTTRHIRPVIFTAQGANAILEMAEVLSEGADMAEHPLFSLGYSNVSPLRWTETAMGLMTLTSGKKIPMMINAEPMAGGTSPVTLAGSILAANAEILSGIVIAQLLEEARPCIYNLGFAHVLDMRTTVALTGSPEPCLFAVSGAEMAAHYDLPCASWVSTDATVIDSQSAYEKMMGFLTHTSAGVNAIWGIGQMEAQLSLSLTQAVLDDEMLGMVHRFLRGFETDAEHLALDVIREVGFDGDFLSHDHTLDHYREELSTSELANRNRRGTWEQDGRKSIEQRAQEKVKKLLAVEKECVTGDQKRELGRIEKSWRKKLGAL